ncbi:MAG: DNA-formamidopyrimidine glycosylase family protein, partial [Spirochaetota bacterium]
MPELPEVQTVVESLVRAGITGRKITGVKVKWPKIVQPMSARVFKDRLIGQRIGSITRRAKY